MGDDLEIDASALDRSSRGLAARAADESAQSAGSVRERPADGRHARRQRNVDAALDALLALIAEGTVEPTVEMVADRAGVSHRSLYRYFETRNGMLEAAFDRVMDALAPELLFESDPDAPFPVRAEQLVASRVRAFVRFRQVGRSAMLQRHHEFIREKVDESRDFLREQLASQFAPELERFDAEERVRRLALADVAFQFEGLEYLIDTVGSSESLSEILVEHLRIVLTAT